MFASYVKAHAANKPQFTYMTNESDALAKIHAGAKPDLFRPYVGWVKYFATSGLVQPWNPSLISNFKHLNPFMVKAGQYGGKQYGIPDDWGFDAILYRTDKVTPKSNSWGLIFDDRYKGKISWFDDLNMLTVAGLYLGFKNPWNQTDARAEAVAGPADEEEEERPADLVVGDEPLGGVRVRRHLDRVRVAERLGADEEEEAEGRVHAAEGEAGRLGRHVHAAEGDAAAEARARVRRRVELDEVGKWLEDNYGYGHANTLARPASSDLLEGAAAHEPACGDRPNAHLDRDIPRRATYANLWEQVKAPDADGDGAT